MMRRSRSIHRWAAGAALIAALSLSIPARACPDCPEGVRKQVRAAIFGEGFARNVGIAALPFGVLAGIVAMIHFGLPERRAGRG